MNDDELARVRAERDSAQEHLAYHLADFRPGADLEATGDLAVDMAAYAQRLAARLAAVEALHYPEPKHGTWCEQDKEHWPCATIRALRAVVTADPADTEEKVTRRLYLLTKAMETGASNLVVMEAVASTAIEHPEWDMEELRTWEEWETTGG